MRASTFLFLPALALASDAIQARSLSAVHNTQKLRARSVDDGLAVTHSALLRYEDKLDVSSTAVPNLELRLDSDQPFLVLEEQTHIIDEVACGLESVIITLKAPSCNDQVPSLTGSYIITSHGTCNQPGGRAIFRVTDVVYFGANATIQYSVTRTTWRDAFPDSKLALSFTPRPELKNKRQVPADLLAFPDATMLDILLGNEPSASSPVDSNTATAGLDFQGINEPCAPGTTFCCQNCTTSGSVSITKSDLEVSLINQEVTGTVALNIQDFNAWLNFNFEMNGQITVPLWQPGDRRPISALTVPDLGSLSIFYNHGVYATAGAEGDARFTYGLSVSLPGQSGATFDFANIGASQWTGFDAADISPIPFTSTGRVTGISIGLAYKPILGIKLTLDDDGEGLAGLAQAGLFLNIPAVTADFTTTTNSDPDCGLSGDTSGLSDILKVTGSMEVNFGAMGKIGAEYDGSNLINTATATTFFATNMPLPTACVGFDSANNVYGDAQQLLASMSGGSASVTGSSSSNGHFSSRVSIGAALAACIMATLVSICL